MSDSETPAQEISVQKNPKQKPAFYECECGSSVKYAYRHSHFATKKHRDFIQTDDTELAAKLNRLANQRKECQNRFRAKEDFKQRNCEYARKYAAVPEHKAHRNIYMRAYQKEYRAKKKAERQQENNNSE